MFVCCGWPRRNALEKLPCERLHDDFSIRYAVCMPSFFLRRLKITPAFREGREKEKLFGASSGSNVCSFRLGILQK